VDVSAQLNPTTLSKNNNCDSLVATRNLKLTAHRAARLSHADTRLMAWARWAKQHPESLGYPRLSIIYKVMRRHAKRLGAVRTSLEARIRGLTARGTETRSLRPRTVGEVPVAINEVDRIVAALDPTQKKIIHIEYLLPEYPEEAKAAEARMYTAEYRRALKRAKLAVADRLTG
jgi:hypothetical protein